MFRALAEVIMHSNRVLIVAITAAGSAQLLKFMLYAWRRRRTRLERLYGVGGMPSSHSAMVTALVASVGYQYGWRTPLFAISAVFGLIVLYDAVSLRQTVGRQSRYLNQVSRTDGLSGLTETDFPEFVGHTPLEVLVGAAWGVALTVIFY